MIMSCDDMLATVGPCSLQALGIPFVIMSASDLKMKCKTFCDANFGPQSPLHWFANMRDQVEGKPCTVHPRASGCMCSSAEASLMVVGAPCHPFSTARTGRYESGSVEQHGEYEATMKDVIGLIQSQEPKVLVSEQVTGFEKPFIAGGSDTPKKELLSMDHLQGEGTSFWVAVFNFLF